LGVRARGVPPLYRGLAPDTYNDSNSSNISRSSSSTVTFGGVEAAATVAAAAC